MCHVERMRRHIGDGPVHFTQMLARKRASPGVELVQNCSRAEKIGRGVDRFVLHLFRRNIRFVFELFDRGLREQVLVFYQPIIQDLQSAILQNLDVRRGQGVVHHTFFLGVVQRGANLLGQGKDFAEFRLALREDLLEGLAFNKLRRHEDGKPFVPAGVKFGDVGMIETAGDTSSGKNLLKQLIDVVQPFRDFELAQGDHPVQLRVLGLVNDPDASAAHFLDQLQTVSAWPSRCGSRSSGVFHGFWHWWRTMASAWERTDESYPKDGLKDAWKYEALPLRK